MMEEVNIWELGERINIKLRPAFLDYFNHQIKEKYRTKRILHKKLSEFRISFGSFKNCLKKGSRQFLPLELIMEVCALLDISVEKLQQNIMAYKMRRSHNIVEQPILPVKITPIFDMLIAHHIGDGTVVNPKNNRKPYFSYRNYDAEYMRLYIKKIESVIGRIKYKREYQDKTRSYCPGVLSGFMFKKYDLNVKSFLSTSARVPKDIMRRQKDHLLAFLIAMIIDEGTIDSGMIVIGLKNPALARDIYSICQTLAYDASYRLRKNDFGYIYILKRGVSKFWSDYKMLLAAYPEVHLGRQGRKIEHALSSQRRQIVRKPGNKHIITQFLSEQPLTVNAIAEKLFMSRQGVRYLLNALESEGKIKKIGRGNQCDYLYSLNRDAE